MERKKIAAVGVEGSPPLIAPGIGALWLSQGSGRGTLLMGLARRSEDDLEQILRLACANQAGRRQVVKEIVVQVEHDNVTFDWEAEFSTDLRLLQPGETLVETSLAKIYKRLFLFEEVEEESRSLYFLRGERGRPARLRGLRPTHSAMVGREDDVSRFTDLIEQVKVDQGQIAAIVGEAGIGKTRLVVALKSLLEERSIPCIEGSYEPRSADKPYKAFREIALKLVGGKIATLSRWEMSDVETDFLRLFIEPGTKIERLAGLSEEQIRHGLFFAVRKLIHSAAREPMALILEDLHWAEPASIDLLEQVMEGMERTRLLLVLVHRPEVEPRWQHRLNFNEFSVAPLSERAVERLLANAVGSETVAANVRSALNRLSLGNPLFVEELLRQMQEAGVLQVETADSGARALRSTGELPHSLPPTLHALIASRLDRLEPEALDLLKWGALLGITFEAPELEGVAKMSGAAFEEARAVLFEKSYLLEQSVFPRHIYRFQHDLIHEIVLDSMPDPLRKNRHAEIGSYLEERYRSNVEEVVERIAEHDLDSDHPEAALCWATRAGKKNRGLYNYPVAESYFRRAVDRWRTLPVVSRGAGDKYFEDWARTLLACGEHVQARKVIDEWSTLGIAEDSASWGNYFLVSAELYRARNDFERCLKAADRAIEILEGESGTEEIRLQAIEHRLHSLVYLGRGGEVIHQGLVTLRRMGDSRFPEAKFRIWSRLAYEAVHGQGEIAQAFDYMKKAEAIDARSISPGDRIDFHSRCLNVMEEACDLERGIAHADSALHIAEQAGMRGREAYARMWRAHMFQEFGNYVRAKRDYEESMERARSLNDAALEVQLLIHLSSWHADIGDDATALDLLQKSETRYPGRLTSAMRSQCEGLRATLMRRAGKPEEAARLFRRAAHRWMEAGNQILHERYILQALAVEASMPGRATAARAEYETLLERLIKRNLLITRIEWWVTDSALTFEGARSAVPDSAMFDPSSVASARLRQKGMLTLLSRFQRTSRKEEMKERLADYRKEREKVAEMVPGEYREVFLRHPEFSPESAGLA